MFLFFLFVLIADGVSGVETDESVMEGDSVTLHTDITEIQNDDTILWLFGPKDSVLSQITRKADFTSFFVTDDAGFSGRLQVDQKTGSLTIRNTRIRHSGQYKLTIARAKTTKKTFNVTVFAVAGETDGVKSEAVMEGESVTLQNHAEVQRDDLIVWRFGDKGILLAKVDLETKELFLNDTDERFRDGLQLNQNGSLTIKKTKTEHAGLYELQIRGRESAQRFLLSVTAVSGPGLSPAGLAGIVVVALLVPAVLASVVIYYRRKISQLEKQMGDDVVPVEAKAEEGKSFTLSTGSPKLQRDDVIQWYYQDESDNNLIAHWKIKPKEGADGRFRGKLIWGENGDLTITDIRTIHSGLYILKISGKTTTKRKKINVSVEVKKIPAKEGGSVHLKTTAEIQNDDLLLWMFGAEKSLVATNAAWPIKTDERFAGRVKRENGCLSISNIRSTDIGHYKLQIINSKQTRCRRFNVTDVLPDGRMQSRLSQCSAHQMESQGEDSVTVVTPLLKEYAGENKREDTTSV